VKGRDRVTEAENDAIHPYVGCSPICRAIDPGEFEPKWIIVCGDEDHAPVGADCEDGRACEAGRHRQRLHRGTAVSRDEQATGINLTRKVDGAGPDRTQLQFWWAELLHRLPPICGFPDSGG